MTEDKNSIIKPEILDSKDIRIRSFGRIKSRKLTDSKIKIIEELLPTYKINNQEDVNNFIKNYKEEKVFLEIGFGYGEHTAHQGKLN